MARDGVHQKRERLFGEVAKTLFAEVLAQARRCNVLASEHFTVDGTLIAAWASHETFNTSRGWSGHPR
jgi:hypothetical protein